MNELTYRALVWLTYRLAATFAVGVPLVLLIWSAWRREPMVLRLLGIYWKVASLMAISLLLLMDQRPLGYATAAVAPVLMVISLWFWVDINEELADQPSWRPLPLVVKVWRWAFSGFGLLSLVMSITGLRCMQQLALPSCLTWLEAPQGIHGLAATVFNFLFGGQWTEAVAAFAGYVALVAYLAGLLQWLLVRLPRYGRVAGDF
uniref:DUF3177 family protein n=1 Tax=Synechococcus sp. UW106 TaxID=368495 RepID=UPI000E0FDF18|nr:DUF3177 family protein [Synechococcus sp. UW106]